MRRQSFVSGAVVLICANIAVKVIGAIFRIPLDHLLGKSGMGMFNVAYVLYTTMLVLSTAGLPVAVSKLVSEADSLGRTREIGRIVRVAALCFIGIGAIFSGALYFGAARLSQIIGNPAACAVVQAISPALFFVSVISVIRGYFQGLSDMRPTAFSQIFEALGKLILGYGLAYRSLLGGLPLAKCAAAAIFGVTLGEALGTLYLLICVFRDSPASHRVLNDAVRPYGAIFKAILYISVPVTVGASVMSLTNLADVALVMNRLHALGLSTTEAGAVCGAYSNRAITLFNLPQTVIIGLSVSVLPVIAGALARQHFVYARKTMLASLRLTALLAFPAGVGYFILGKPIVVLLFGTDAVSAGDMLALLGLAVPFVSAVSLTGAILQAMGHPGMPVVNMLLGGAVKLIGNYILIGLPGFGIYGAPISTLVCYLVIACGNFRSIHRVSDVFDGAASHVLPTAFAALGMGAGGKLLFELFAPRLGGNLAVLLTIPFTAVLYLVLLLGLQALHAEDIRLLPHGEALCRVLKLS